MLDDNRFHVAVKTRPAKPVDHDAEQVTTAPQSPAELREESGVPLKSRVIKRSIVIGGHRTSVSLEDAFWEGLKEIARDRQAHISDIVCAIDGERQHCNLSSAIRLYVFSHFHK